MRLNRFAMAVSVLVAVWSCSSGSVSNDDVGVDAPEIMVGETVSQMAIHAVSPPQGSGWGGEKVSILGEGFVEGLTVRFGGLEGTEVLLVSEQLLEMTTPKLGAGVWDVEVEGPDGQLVKLDAAYETAPLELKFVEVPPFSLPQMTKGATTCGASADFDGDGYLDLVLCTDGEFRFLAGDGNGNFTDTTWPADPVPPDAPPPIEPDVQEQDVHATDVSIVDINNWPGSPDIAYDIPYADIVEEPPVVPESRFPDGVFDCRYMVAADMDLDNTVDLFVSTGAGQRHLLLLNAGTGYFFDDPEILPEGNLDDGAGVAVGDVDGDGFPDVVVANRNASPDETGQLRVWLFRITGGFTALEDSGLPAVAEVGSAVALTDVDGDGDLDIVTGAVEAADGTTVRLYLNDDSLFSVAPAGMLPAVTSPVSHMTVADLDGDDAPELFLLDPNGQDLLLVNDGQGHFFDFTMTGLPVDKAEGVYSTAGDVNLDGHLDLIIANHGGQNRLYLNDGGAMFADHTPLFPIYYDDSTWAFASDVDADGDLDVLFLNGAGHPNRLYLSVPPEVTP